MAAKWIEFVTGQLDQKKQYKESTARMKALPEPYRSAAEACDRYATHTGRITDGDNLIQAHSDLADLFEQAAADSTPIADVLGADPVDFIEDFVDAYTGKQWIDKERTRLRDAIAGLASAPTGSAAEPAGSAAEPAGEDDRQ